MAVVAESWGCGLNEVSDCHGSQLSTPIQIEELRQKGRTFWTKADGQNRAAMGRTIAQIDERGNVEVMIWISYSRNDSFQYRDVEQVSD
jgi:hypothetical protein